MRHFTQLRKHIAFVALLSVAALGMTGCPVSPPQVMPSVDLTLYVGLWYQISAYPTFFNRNLVGVTAEYTLMDVGVIDVLIKGFEGSLDGTEVSITGEARVVDTDTNAKLEVAFDFPLGNLLKGEYWIVDLDTTFYQYAAVSDSRRSTLFILSRTPQIDQGVYEGILDRLEANGFDTSKLILTPQPNP